MKLVLIGAPAAGKGTQARRLIHYYGLAYIATGDILREHIDKETDLGKAIKQTMAEGKLVSDDMIIEIVANRIKQDDCKNGFILDGFPRTTVQAEKLDELVGTINKAIYINVPDDILLERISVRESCPKCGASYHPIFNPSKKRGVCNECGTTLTQRKDDTYKTGLARLKTFHESSEPLIDYYGKKNLLFEVNGLDEIDHITQSIIHELGEKS